MWELPPDVRWDLSRSHSGRARVDVLSRGELVAEAVEILDGSVTEKWVSGPRSTLALQVEPSASWIRWFKLPKLELQVWSGISWGRSEYLIPMGIFVVTDRPDMSWPSAAAAVAAVDRFQWVAQNDLLYAWPAPAGKASALAARLIVEGGLPDVSIDVERDLDSPGVMWEGRRMDLIRDYLDPAGLDAFVDRTGLACIRTRRTQPGRPLTHGVDGTLVKVSSSVKLAGVFNAVGAASTKSDVVIDPPPFVAITDPNHPAHQDRIGERKTLVTSNSISNYGDAINYARAELAKRSAAVLGWTAECVPDPTRMPGDLTPVTPPDGDTVEVVVQEVTHPLVVDADSKTQRITFGAAA